jgi:hypothetical protein
MVGAGLPTCVLTGFQAWHTLLIKLYTANGFTDSKTSEFFKNSEVFGAPSALADCFTDKSGKSLQGFAGFL